MNVNLTTLIRVAGGLAVGYSSLVSIKEDLFSPDSSNHSRVKTHTVSTPNLGTTSAMVQEPSASKSQAVANLNRKVHQLEHGREFLQTLPRRADAGDQRPSLARVATVDATDVRAALAVFEFSQKAPEIWRGSKMLEKRRILETVSLNRRLGDVSLVLEKRKPFDELAKRPQIQSGRGDRTAIELIPPALRLWSRLLSLSAKTLADSMFSGGCSMVT